MLQIQQFSSLFSQRPSDAAKAFVERIVIFMIVCLAALSGAFEPLNMSLMDIRFRLLQRDPSDTLTVVVIDPESLRKEDRWPWPRDRYAKAVANLQDAGAALVAFDVDFSALSDEAGDAAFAKSLAQRPGEVILPVFSQWSSRSATDGAFIQTPPHSYFLDDAVMASVNLTTEKNGLVRQGWLGFDDNGAIRPSIASVLADEPVSNQQTFYLDYGINPSSIKQLSFSDVLSGEFSKESVAGKKILIGATALELGDEFAAPVWGVTPGVMFHAISYESLLQDRALKRLHYCIPLILAFFVIFWLCDKRKYRTLRKAVTYHSALLTVLVGAPVLFQLLFPVSLDAGAILAAQGLCIFYMTGSTIQRYTRKIIQERAATAHYQMLTGIVVQDNSDGVIVANAAGVIELCNDRAKDYLGAAAMKSGCNILDYADKFPLFAEAETSASHQKYDYNGEQAIHSEYIVENNDNLVLEVVASCSSPDNEDARLADNGEKSQRFVYTLRDISARKRLEIAEREAKDAAIAANKLKSELISNMSHELRTPLNGIIGFADIIQKESFGPAGVPEYKEYSESIYTSGKRLLNLVNDMLNIAKIDADSFELSKGAMGVDELIEHCLAAFEKRTLLKGDSIRVNISKRMPEVEVDLNVFSEIFSHLLTNAVEFTDDKPVIEMRAKQDRSDLVLEFVDNGCGIDPAHLPKLTEAFYQGDSSLSRQHEGAGLGLYIVSKLTALHGGTLELKSKEGVGFLARLRFAGVIAKVNRAAA